MRYQALDANGDYTFGQNGANFLVDSPAAVGQAVLTRLKLVAGEWFIDTTVGVPYNTKILGKGTLPLVDSTMQDTIVNTPGVLNIADYASQVTDRSYQMVCTINTIYGTTQITATL